MKTLIATKLVVHYKMCRNRMAFQSTFSAFFKHFIRVMKLLLKKQLKTYRLNCEQMQTLLKEIEPIVNNRPLNYVYPTELETYITPNHLLFGRILSFLNLEPAPLITKSSSIKLYSSKISNIINHVWDRRRKEYVTGLRKYRGLQLYLKRHSGTDVFP